MKMPMGAHKGQPVEAMSTAYLLWVISNDHIRFKRWPLIQEALRVLRGRFENFETLLAELEVKAPPPAYWKTKEQIEARAKARAEKLRQLEERRAAEREQRRQELRARFKQREAEQTQIIDASYYVRAARQRPADPGDVSDLV
ncbi:MAG: hypothetical protein ACYC0P_02745 [Thiobacillus sp.]